MSGIHNLQAIHGYNARPNLSRANLRSIIFINGVGNFKQDAVSSAESIADRINESIVGFWNPTLTNLHPTGSLISELAGVISTEHNRCRGNALLQERIRIILVAHSHGAYLVNEALQQAVIIQIKDDIEVVTVGPAVILPISCARRVQNFINAQDAISISAQINTSNRADSFSNFLKTVHEFLAEKDIVLVKPNPIASIAVSLALKAFYGELEGRNENESLQDVIKSELLKHSAELGGMQQEAKELFTIIYSITALFCKFLYPVKITISNQPYQKISDVVQHDFVFYLDRIINFIG